MINDVCEKHRNLMWIFILGLMTWQVEHLEKNSKKISLCHSKPATYQTPQSKKRPLPFSPLYFLPISPPNDVIGSSGLICDPESNYMEGVWSIWVRLRAHLPRNKDSVTGELWASQNQPSLAANESGILSSVTSHCCEAAAPHVSKVTCKGAA